MNVMKLRRDGVFKLRSRIDSAICDSEGYVAFDVLPTVIGALILEHDFRLEACSLALI